MNGLTVVTQGLLSGALAAGLYVSASTHEAAELWPKVSPGHAQVVELGRDALPTNVPHWRKGYAKRFPGCRPVKVNGAAPNVLVVHLDATVSVMDVGEVVERWDRDENRANDVWVVGHCD